MSIAMITWIAVGSVALISLIALLKVVLLNRRMQADLQQRDERVEKLDNELTAVLDGNYGMGNQLNDLRQDLKDTKEKQQQLEQRDLGALPYNQAVRMVASGATADQLVEQCGLSRSEADLIMLLHQNSPPVVEPLQQESLPQEPKQEQESAEEIKTDFSEGDDVEGNVEQGVEASLPEQSEEEDIPLEDGLDDKDFDELAKELEQEFNTEPQISDVPEVNDYREKNQTEVFDTVLGGVDEVYPAEEAHLESSVESEAVDVEPEEEKASDENQSVENLEKLNRASQIENSDAEETTPDYSTIIERASDPERE